MTRPGQERVILIIDGCADLAFVRNGWFFGQVSYHHKLSNEETYISTPYRDFVDSVKPDWKSYSAHSEYYIDGKWNRRTAACGEVRL